MQQQQFINTLRSFCFVVGSLCCVGTSQVEAQYYADWSDKMPILIQENAGVTHYDHPVLLKINTAAPFSAGKMAANGDDIRFAKTCAGNDTLAYWIEDYFNTDSTLIWVNIDTLPANGSLTLFMFYNNPGAPPTSDVDSTFTDRRIITSNETTSDTLWEHDWVEIESGVTVDLSVNHPGRLTIKAPVIKIAGTLNGNGSGYAGGAGSAGAGPGGGGAETITGGGGAGYGDEGGNGGYNSTNYDLGGDEYGNETTIGIWRGSGGGASLWGGVAGGDGGGAFILEGSHVQISGEVTVDGDDGITSGSHSGSGAGSGGGILIKGQRVVFSGNLSANGGQGGASVVYYGGGGGAGGRIKIFYEDVLLNTGSTNVMWGPGGGGCCTQAESGGTGTFHNATASLDMPTHTVQQAVFADAGPDQTVCQGDSIQIGGSPTGPPGSVYSWIPAESVSLQAANPLAFPNDTTTYTLTVNDPYGCTATDSVTVYVTNSSLNAEAGPDTTICQEDTVKLIATGGSAFSWSPSSDLSCTNCQTPLASPSVTTQYMVTVSSGNCQPATDSVTVSIQQPPVDAGPDRMLCKGDSIQLSAGGSPTSGYTWRPSAGLSDPNVADPWASPADTTTYKVTVTDSIGCTAADSITVMVLPLPVAAFAHDVAGDTVRCTNMSTNAEIHIWDFGDDNTSEDTDPVHVYAKGGIYPICLTAKSTCGENVRCDSVYIVADDTVHVPDLTDEPSVKIYPNPAADGRFVVELSGVEASSSHPELKVLSVAGRQVDAETEIHHGNQQIQIRVHAPELAGGVYLIQITGLDYFIHEKLYLNKNQ